MRPNPATAGLPAGDDGIPAISCFARAKNAAKRRKEDVENLSQKVRVRPKRPPAVPVWAKPAEQGALAVVALITLYLTWVHYTGGGVVCPATGPIHCARVLTGPGSTVLGLPYALWGTLWAVAGLLRPLWAKGQARLATQIWEVIGLLALAWALTFEWVDGAICLWCSVAQLFILGAIALGHWTRPQATVGTTVSFWSGGIWLAALLSLAIVAGQSTSASPVAASGGFSLRDLNNQPVSLPSGPVVVEVMAPWCEYCATTAKWLNQPDAAFAQKLGVRFVLVDASPLGGVGQAAQAPTLQSIAATARDGSGQKLSSNAEIAANLKDFVRQYPMPGVSVYFLPLGATLPAEWQANAFPSFVLLDAQHRPVAHESGFLTESQFQAWLTQAQRAAG